MDDAQRRIEIRKLIKEHTKTYTTSKEVARKRLIEEGIYTSDGRLRPEFGGKPKKSKTAA